MSKKFKDLEIQMASSILYYDEEEFAKFFEIYDGLLSNPYTVIDGLFDKFVCYARKFKGFDKDSAIRKKNLVEELEMRNHHDPNEESREVFSLWLEKVLDTNVPMELSEDILSHFIWDEHVKAIENINKSDVPFSQKLLLRPQAPQILYNDGLIFLDDIQIEEDDGNSYTSGLKELDQIVKFVRTNFVVIAARPGVGKSLFMLQQAIENARAGVKTIFMSFEMPKTSVFSRILDYYNGADVKNQFTDPFGVVDFQGFIKACEGLKRTKDFKTINQNLQLYESKVSSADAILTAIESQIDKFGYEVIFIDYLQLLRFNKADEWSSLRTLTNSLKNLAFRKNVLIITGSQVSRSSTEHGLSLSDLFGSSSIEADTDVVIGLESSRERRQGERAIISVKVMKNREGDLAELKYIVDYSCGKLFYNE